MDIRALLIGCGLLIASCTEPDAPADVEPPGALAASAAPDVDPPTIEHYPNRDAYFGELHVHTGLSFDAYIFGTGSTPDTAYEFAKGAPLAHPAGFEMRIKQPLDFLAVTDHAMYMGMLPAMDRPETKAGKHPIAVAIREAKSSASRIAAFQAMFPYLRQQLEGPDDLLDQAVVRTAWQETVPLKFLQKFHEVLSLGFWQRENVERGILDLLP